MSGADDLRTAIAIPLLGLPMVRNGHIESIVKVLADPRLRLVILDAMGLVVQRGGEGPKDWLVVRPRGAAPDA